MNNSNAEFCTATWNPIDGCLHNCRHCSARTEAERCGGHRSFASYMAQDEPIDTGVLRILDFPMRDEVTGEAEAFPFIFSPTYHRHRLSKLQTMTRPENILVCGKGDLFGAWVDDWIVQEVLEHAEAAHWHNYLFISKNPARYDTLDKKAENMFYGAAIDTGEQASAIIASKARSLDFLKINSIHTAIDLDKFLNESQSQIRWMIVCAETGISSGKINMRGWLMTAADICASLGIPLFCEQSLKKLMGDAFRQEYPQILHKTMNT